MRGGGEGEGEGGAREREGQGQRETNTGTHINNKHVSETNIPQQKADDEALWEHANGNSMEMQ